jgi:hypothetical protein
VDTSAPTAQRFRPGDVRARLRVDVAGELCSYWVEIEATEGRLCRLDLATARHLAVQVLEKVGVAERMAAEQARVPVVTPD